MAIAPSGSALAGDHHCAGAACDSANVPGVVVNNSPRSGCTATNSVSGHVGVITQTATCGNGVSRTTTTVNGVTTTTVTVNGVTTTTISK